MKIKIIAPLMAYVTIAIGLFWARSAWAALLGFHAAILSSLFFAKPNIPLSFLLKTQDQKWVLLSILLCGSSGVSLYFLWSYFGVAEDFSAELNSIGLTRSTWPAFIAYFVLINPFVEEYFWRGFLGSTVQNISIYDAIFAGYHILLLIGKVHYASIVLVFALLTLAGWFWRQITDRDGGLLAPVLGHMAADRNCLAKAEKQVAKKTKVCKIAGYEFIPIAKRRRNSRSVPSRGGGSYRFIPDKVFGNC